MSHHGRLPLARFKHGQRSSRSSRGWRRRVRAIVRTNHSDTRHGPWRVVAAQDEHYLERQTFSDVGAVSFYGCYAFGVACRFRAVVAEN